MKKTAEVIVIGGGIMGVSTAYQLAKRGVEVTLLEKSHLAAGSTGLTGGIIRQHYSVEATAKMAKRALEVWMNFDRVVGGDPGFVKTGVIFLTGPEGAADMDASVKMQQGLGIRTELLDAQSLKELAPYLHTRDVGAAAYEPDGGFADGSMACAAYAARAVKLGARFYQGVEVKRIRLSGGKVSGVETPNGRVEAPVVVNTAGPWGPSLAREAGVDIPAAPSRHQIATFFQPEGFPAPMHPVIGDFVNGHYMRPDRGGLTLAGSLEDDTTDSVPDPDVFNPGVDRSFVSKMVDRAVLRIPGFSAGRVQGGWAGLYTVTPDWTAIIDRVPAVPGLVVGLGFSGSGFKLGPVVGEMLADLAVGETRCPIDPSIFRLSRFSEGVSSTGAYRYGILG